MMVIDEIEDRNGLMFLRAISLRGVAEKDTGFHAHRKDFGRD